MDRPTRNVFGALQYTAPRFKLDNTLPLVLETIRITCRFNPRGGGGGWGVYGYFPELYILAVIFLFHHYAWMD